MFLFGLLDNSLLKAFVSQIVALKIEDQGWRRVTCASLSITSITSAPIFPEWPLCSDLSHSIFLHPHTCAATATTTARPENVSLRRGGQRSALHRYSTKRRKTVAPHPRLRRQATHLLRRRSRRRRESRSLRSEISGIASPRERARRHHHPLHWRHELADSHSPR